MSRQGSPPGAEEPADEELMHRFRAGEARAFFELARRHQGGIYRHVLRLCRDAHRAEDLAQETFLSVYRGRATWDAALPFRPWLYRIATNCFLQARRVAPAAPVAGGPAALETPAPGAGPGAMAEHEELLAIVRSCVDALPEEQKLVLLLRQNAGLTLAEVGAALDLPVGTAKSRYAAGLASLRKLLRTRLWGSYDELRAREGRPSAEPGAGRD